VTDVHGMLAIYLDGDAGLTWLECRDSQHLDETDSRV
jgi:hypothetical protein